MSKDTIPDPKRVADPEETSRRDIVLGVITIGAAGAALVVGAEAEAQVTAAPGGLTATAPARQMTPPARRHYQVAFTRAPSLGQVQASLGRALGIAGCPTCGLVGFDLRLRIDPRAQGQSLGDGAIILQTPGG